MANVLLRNIDKIYANGFQAVHKANIEIEDKEFMILVGPSGCGKSTTLRMIAGLETISNGELTIEDRIMNDIPPKDRDIAMVFQDYALYPHMTVYNNLAFALKIRRMSKADIDQRVQEAAKILHIEQLLKRKPKMMSGGQRQRVALGRAIVRKPKVFLFDEPLSNLDAKLRVVMRAELSILHKKLETTMVYVTHDQVEAMTMATRIVVMKDGYVQQIDSPYNLYNYPKNKFVGGFIGSPPMNFIKTVVKKENNEIVVGNNDFTIVPNDKQKKALEPYLTKEIHFGVRPEHLMINKDEFKNKINAFVEVVEPLGAESLLYIATGNAKDLNIEDANIIAKVNPEYQVSIGQRLEMSINIDKCHFFENDISINDAGNKEEKCII